MERNTAGVPNLPATASQNETDLFPLTGGDEEVVNKGLEIALVHPMSVPLKELAPVTITLMTISGEFIRDLTDVRSDGRKPGRLSANLVQAASRRPSQHSDGGVSSGPLLV